jgi:ubiquinone/menaquinone biosynthesis C-methylase UbiE
MEKTIVEAMRVLKKGGILICYDRAHPNSLTNEHKKYLLSIDYSKQFKKNHKLNPEIPFTREQNGEHEPRLKEWINSFHRAGSTLTKAQISFFIRRKMGKGANLSIYFKLFMYHLFPLVGNFGQIKIQTFYTILSSSNAPLGKMVLIAKKN